MADDKIEKLNDQNLEIWKFKMELKLMKEKLMKFVLEPKPKLMMAAESGQMLEAMDQKDAAMVSAEEMATWLEKDGEARHMIAMAVENDQLVHICPYFAKEMNAAETQSLEIEAAEQTPARPQLSRRSLSGGVLSPEVELAPSTSSKLVLVGQAIESDGFYLLKKDSQRRTTLAKVLTNDVVKIYEVWLSHLESTHMAKVMITRAHLETLLVALRKFIAEQRIETLAQAIAQLKEQVDYDSTAIDQLKLALYSFEHAVSTVLRSHNIKPHWMFALDNLVSSAVNAGILILSPELDANPAGQGVGGSGSAAGICSRGQPYEFYDGYDDLDLTCCEEGENEDGNDGDHGNDEGSRTIRFDEKAAMVSHQGVNPCAKKRFYYDTARRATAGAKSSTATAPNTYPPTTLNKQMMMIRKENSKLKKYITESQNSYLRAFRTVLESGSFAPCHTDQLVTLMMRCLNEQLPDTPEDFLIHEANAASGTQRVFHPNHTGQRILTDDPVTELVDQTLPDTSQAHRARNHSAGVEDIPGSDRRLAQWLTAQGIDCPASRLRILGESFRYDNFLNDLERSDLRRLGLKMGIELSIWTSLKHHRRLHRSKQSHSNDDNGSDAPNGMANGKYC